MTANDRFTADVVGLPAVFAGRELDRLMSAVSASELRALAGRALANRKPGP